MCVLKQITPRELGEGEPILVWWRGQGHPSPLLMTEEEAHNSADSFPIEFRDMQHHRKVLQGVDVKVQPGVPIEAVADRASTPHDQALFDMGRKYADVIPERDVLAALAGS